MTPVAYLYWVLLATLLPTLPSFSFRHRDSRLGGSSGLFQGNRPGEPGSPIASSQGVLIVRLFATFCYLLYRHKVQIITRKAEGLYYSSIFCELRCDQMVLWDFCGLQHLGGCRIASKIPNAPKSKCGISESEKLPHRAGAPLLDAWT